MTDGRIAVIGIGDSPVFNHLQSISNSLKIPFISIKWNGIEEENSLIANEVNHNNADEISLRHSQINIHPPAHKMMKAIINLIEHYKWDFVTIIYQESYGLDRVEDLIRFPRMLGNKFRLNVRQLGPDVDKWVYLIKDVKLSGSSHIIVDVNTKYLNKFLQQVFKLNTLCQGYFFIF